MARSNLGLVKCPQQKNTLILLFHNFTGSLRIMNSDYDGFKQIFKAFISRARRQVESTGCQDTAGLARISPQPHMNLNPNLLSIPRRSCISHFYYELFYYYRFEGICIHLIVQSSPCNLHSALFSATTCHSNHVTIYGHRPTSSTVPHTKSRDFRISFKIALFLL